MFLASSFPIRGKSCVGIWSLKSALTECYRHKIVAKRGAAFTIMVTSRDRQQAQLCLTSCRSPASQDSERRPSSTRCSQLQSRTTPIISVGTQSKSIKPWKLRSLRQSWRRSSSKVTTPTGLFQNDMKLMGGTVRLTVIDTPGFGDYVNNRDSWMPIIEFLDDQHESYMLQEQQPRRGDKIDLRVHACLYFIRPTGHTLKPLDIEVMKRLSSRVNLIPVVAKADTLSPADLARFKHRVCG